MRHRCVMVAAHVSTRTFANVSRDLKVRNARITSVMDYISLIHLCAIREVIAPINEFARVRPDTLGPTVICTLVSDFHQRILPYVSGMECALLLTIVIAPQVTLEPNVEVSHVLESQQPTRALCVMVMGHVPTLMCAHVSLDSTLEANVSIQCATVLQVRVHLCVMAMERAWEWTAAHAMRATLVLPIVKNQNVLASCRTNLQRAGDKDHARPQIRASATKDTFLHNATISLAIFKAEIRHQCAPHMEIVQHSTHAFVQQDTQDQNVTIVFALGKYPQIPVSVLVMDRVQDQIHAHAKLDGQDLSVPLQFALVAQLDLEPPRAMDSLAPDQISAPAQANSRMQTVPFHSVSESLIRG
mmetsp:Transcript_4037/g.15194  ORF Transcript_4037/g.15194 Transcript_4037/m.15194 type:complete len:357 (+) Transcript_4037:3849-4919(+)